MPFIPGFYGTCEDGIGGAGTVSAPGQVTGLSVSVVSSSQLNLSWNAVSGATTYKVERSTSSGSDHSFTNPVCWPCTAIFCWDF